MVDLNLLPPRKNMKEGSAIFIVQVSADKILFKHFATIFDFDFKLHRMMLFNGIYSLIYMGNLSILMIKSMK